MASTHIKKHIVMGVWTGHYTTRKLPADLYRKNGKHLAKGIKQGYKATVKFGTKDDLMIKSLTENIWFFSAAKTYQNIRGMEAAKEALKKVSSSFYNEDKEEISTFKAFRDGYYTAEGDFIEGASQIFDTYNETWLKSEYNTARAMAQMASRWQRIQDQKEVLPYLRYTAIEDGILCEICAALDGIVRRVDDGFWDVNYPPQHYNTCRCDVEQLDESEGGDNESSEEEANAASDSSDDKGRNPLFRMNVGKDKVVFQEDGTGKHPYFDVAKGDKDLLKNNFNLPKL